jgi:hypothetical protein
MAGDALAHALYDGANVGLRNEGDTLAVGLAAAAGAFAMRQPRFAADR